MHCVQRAKFFSTGNKFLVTKQNGRNGEKNIAGCRAENNSAFVNVLCEGGIECVEFSRVLWKF